jgi:hypothetical protein
MVAAPTVSLSERNVPFVQFLNVIDGTCTLTNIFKDGRHHSARKFIVGENNHRERISTDTIAMMSDVENFEVHILSQQNTDANQIVLIVSDDPCEDFGCERLGCSVSPAVELIASRHHFHFVTIPFNQHLELFGHITESDGRGFRLCFRFTFRSIPHIVTSLTVLQVQQFDLLEEGF